MNFKLTLLVLSMALVFASCGDDKKKKPSYNKSTVKKEVKATTKLDINAPSLDNKGIGPVKSLELGAIDKALVAKGKEAYKAKCTACHKFKKRYIGPALKGVTKRRSPEWIMNMILNPEEMLVKDPVAKALIAEYNAPMANQQLTKEEARAILEYFRTKN